MPTRNHSRIEEIEARGAPSAGTRPLPGLPGGGLVERGELSDELVDELLAGARTPEEIVGAKAWQARPLEALYAIVYLDALVLKIRDGGAVRNHACYLAIGVNLDGERDVLGTWFQRTEGAKFWLAVLTDLRQRGVADVLVVCVDGVTGFPDAIEAVFPRSCSIRCGRMTTIRDRTSLLRTPCARRTDACTPRRTAAGRRRAARAPRYCCA